MTRRQGLGIGVTVLVAGLTCFSLLRLFRPVQRESVSVSEVKGHIARLQEGDGEERARSAVSLGLLRHELAVEPLIAALRDKNQDVRTAAAGALGEIGDARAVEPLIKALKDEPDFWRTPIDSLVRIGAPAVGPLIDALQDGRHFAELALLRIGAAAVGPLIDALKNQDHDRRADAAWILGRIGGPKAVGPLVGALEDRNARVRAEAAMALGNMGNAMAVPPLIEALRNTDSYVSSRAAWHLGNLGDPRAVSPLIEVLEETDWRDWRVRREAARALGKLGHPRAVGALAALLNDRDEDVRAHAVRALGNMGEAAALPLTVALRDEIVRIRKAAAEALINIGTPASEPLLEALKDDSPTVQWLVGKTLAEMVSSMDGQEFSGFLHTAATLASQRPAMAMRVHLVLAQACEGRGEKEEAERQWAKTGFIREPSWLLIRKGSGLDRIYPPEQGMDLTASYPGHAELTGWRPADDRVRDAWIPFLPSGKWSDCAGYALAYIRSPTKRKAQLCVGSSNDIRVWLNGEEVLARSARRSGHVHFAILEEYVVAVELEAGRNELLLRVYRARGVWWYFYWGFFLSITDPEGRAFEDLEYLPAAEVLGESR